MSHKKIFILTLLAMIAFAGNSLLCRFALKHTSIDAASFTSIRLIAGAIALWLIVRARNSVNDASGSWPSAFALFAYTTAFSFSYVSLSAATGALLLFGTVQATMISYGLWSGERFSLRQMIGLIVACSGLIGLLLPGLSSPPLIGSMLMVAAGIAWGIYSLRGKGAGDPTRVSAGNFWRAALFAILLSVIMLPRTTLDSAGIWAAVLSGALTSGVGYAVWYTALRGLKATSAATVQLSVPLIAAVGGIIFLGELISVRLFVSSVAILGGVALVILEKQRSV
jgi:drug/metabolite transporter (DMT)-like permease